VGREVDRFLALHLAPGADQRSEVPA
jgi:hypothetical protein